MERVDCVVVGAGLIGLAVARELAMQRLEVLVLEAAGAIGTETSSRNSEVVHAGIYYEPESLKTRLCVEGRQLLYAYANDRGVPVRQCGKMIVATDPGQIAELQAIQSRAVVCGVDDLRMISKQEALDLEPEINCNAALLSPSTGIIDSHALMLAYLADAENSGAVLSLNTTVVSGRVDQSGFLLETRNTVSGELYEIGTSRLVNSAGLGANALAGKLAGFPVHMIPPLHLARGSYFSVSGKPKFQRLIYPVPEVGGLGVHLTLDLAGNMRFGPDVEWIEEKSYFVDPSRSSHFYERIRKYWPGLPEDSLIPSFCGIRPKLAAPGQPEVDFVLQGPLDHKIEGLVNMFGIESPGLTSSLALANRVKNMLQSPLARAV